MSSAIIEKVVFAVQGAMQIKEGGHDYSHTYRVWRNTQLLCRKIPQANQLLCEVAALCHDIGEPKFYNYDEGVRRRSIAQIIKEVNFPQDLVADLFYIIEHMSFKDSLGQGSLDKSIEFQIVQDADRLEAIGAVGIARAFSYGGYKERPFFDANIPPVILQDKASYKNLISPTINHFYEKLLLLIGQMNTEYGKEVAKERHQIMIRFLADFYNEIGYDPKGTAFDLDKFKTA